MGSWGIDLWDQRDIIEKHTHNSIDFLDKCASFVKERVRVEQEYAKALRRLVKQYQFKRKEEEDLLYTYQHAFKTFLYETDDFAGQREVIAEEMQNKILKEMHKTSIDSKTERKKTIQTLNESRNHLEQLNKALQVAKKRYDQASEDASTAYKSYEQANQSLDLTKAQILKFQKASQDKGHISNRCRDEYAVALDNFNKTQTLYYDGDLPDTINKELQTPEEWRIAKLSEFFCQIAGIQQNVQPIISKCLEGIVAAGKSCNPGKDSLTLIDHHKTGESPPSNVVFEEWSKPGGNNQGVTPSPLTKNKIKANKSIFGMNTKKKETLSNENIANDFAEFPPAQRRKKFNKTISALQEQITQLDKSKAGMVKLVDTSSQFGGDISSIQSQISASEKEIEKLKALQYQYQCYLAAMDGTDGKPASRPVSNANFPPPPVEKQGSLQGSTPEAPPPPPMSPDFVDDFDDEMRCTALYDFSGNNESEMSIYAGEELILVEEDDGSGWTRVLRGDEEGYIPTSYVQKI